MSYDVAYVFPKKMYPWADGWVLECKCRVEKNGQWVRTVRVRVPFPIYYEPMYHMLCEHLDVGSIHLQQHMEYHIPHEFPESIN